MATLRPLSVTSPAGCLAAANGGFVKRFGTHGFPHTCQNRRRDVSIKAVAAAPKKALEALQYRKLGDSDLVISEITLGTMTWGQQNTEKEGQEQLAYAFDQGINMFDTAEAYPIPMSKETQGRTDLIISGWLKTVPRDKVIVATKVSGYSERNTYLREGGGTVRVDRKNIKESVEKSLKRLGTDHIDLLQIHWPDRYVPIFGEYLYNFDKVRDSVPFEEQLQALDEVIKEGKVRYIGVSNETSYGVTEFLHAAKTLGLPKIVSIQNSYSLIVRTQFEVDLVEVCAPHNGNIGLLAYSPLAGGCLTGKYRSISKESMKKSRFGRFPGFMDRYTKSLPREAIALYCDIAERNNCTPTELALLFCRDRQFMTSTIIGATSMDQLKENIHAFQLPRPLSKEVDEEIESVFKRYRDPTFQ